MARLIDVTLPDFGLPADMPRLDDAIYERRMAAFLDALDHAGLDVAVVYADREHCANLHYLTEFDPRFEEALLILKRGREPVILAGPENVGRAAACRVHPKTHLYPPFGLLGQDRTKTPPLADLLADAGIATGQRIGVLGWKYYGPHEAEAPETWLETPAFIVDTLRRLAGASGRVVNANALLMECTAGLRATCEIDQLAQFEFAAAHASEGIKRLIFGIRPGMTEHEAMALTAYPGIPLSCHSMLSTGSRLVGLDSPSGKVVAKGEPITSALGYWGALTSRAGWLVEGPDDLPEAAHDYLERVAIPFFDTAAEWYEAVGIGAVGGELDALVRRRLGDPFYNLILNFGHLIHIDEWLNTPVYPGSTETFRSHQAVQCDIIPAVKPPYYGTNIEDGIALLDENGRAEFAERHPEAQARVEARRAFMEDVLGIRLKPEVLPFSNIPAYLTPFFLSPTQALSRR